LLGHPTPLLAQEATNIAINTKAQSLTAFFKRFLLILVSFFSYLNELSRKYITKTALMLGKQQ